MEELVIGILTAIRLANLDMKGDKAELELESNADPAAAAFYALTPHEYAVAMRLQAARR